MGPRWAGMPTSERSKLVRGRISFFGGLPKNDPFIRCDSNVVHYRQLHIHGANGSAPEHNKRALEYISTGQVPVKDLITRHIPLDDVLEAFQIVKNGEAIKVTVEACGYPAGRAAAGGGVSEPHSRACEAVTGASKPGVPRRRLVTDRRMSCPFLAVGDQTASRPAPM